jgi:phospholipid-translocating ATPase
MAYLVFAPATFATSNGQGIDDRERMGVYVACPTILVVNSYVVLNAYHWDWLFLLIFAISTLLIWCWTGIYTSFTASFQFYKAGAEVYGTLTFWALCLLTLVICLLPRFSIKFFQKNYRPLDIDIVREQVRQGKFKYLDQYEAYIPPKAVAGSDNCSSDPEQPVESNVKYQPVRTRAPSMPESQRPLYPPSEAPTGTIRNPRSQSGSDGTDRTRFSAEQSSPITYRVSQASFEKSRSRRPTLEKVRSSFERSLQSTDRMRPSFEGSRDFTSAALLSRVESTHSSPTTPGYTSRLQNISAELE